MLRQTDRQFKVMLLRGADMKVGIVGAPSRLSLGPWAIAGC
jgi:hypothetical protein